LKAMSWTRVVRAWRRIDIKLKEARLMHTDFTRISFAVITIFVVAATVFRVATAPDRVDARKATARSVCIESGGQWVPEGRDAICVKQQPDTATKG
jgi:hypothetical protein